MAERGGVRLAGQRLPRVSFGGKGGIGQEEQEGISVQERKKGPRVRTQKRGLFAFFRNAQRLLSKGNAHQAMVSLASGPGQEKVPFSQQEKRSFLEKSTASAMHTMEATSEVVLEELKKRAAMQAIKRQMQLWRRSIRADRRLTPQARQEALHGVDKHEKLLVAKEMLKWHKGSIVQAISRAAMRMNF